MGVCGEKIIWGQDAVRLEGCAKLGFRSGQSREP